MRYAFLSTILTIITLGTCALSPGQEPTIAVGSNRELFIDDYLVQETENVEFMTHRPERKEIVMEFTYPWELGNEGYASIMAVDGGYRMYYRAWGVSVTPIPMLYCVAESVDGRHWTRPALDIVEYRGVRDNNIILEHIPGTTLGMHDFTPFVDQRPGCPAEERYKAVGHGWTYGESDRGPHGLYGWKSADGLHWSLVKDGPVFTEGMFDSQNIAFWSTTEQKYVLYYRQFVGDVRVVMKATSEDFENWTNVGEIQYLDNGGPTAREQFYTNQIQQYYRAPQIYIGAPARYVDNGMTASTPQLPQWEERQRRMKIFKGGERLGTATTDVLLMTSRDGTTFRRANDVFITPGLRTKENWFYGDNYTAWNILETPSADDDSPNELSIYVMESTNALKPSHMRRYALRIDGFGSLRAKAKVGTVLTKPLTFDGSELSLNVATTSAGFVKVEVLDETGAVIPGYSHDECDLVFGDSLDRRVTWNGSADMSKLSGKTIRLRMTLYECDVYSLKWE